MLPLGNIIRKYNLSFHFFADDSQLYLPLRSRDCLQTLLECLKEINDWMGDNFLQLNNSKTEVIIVNPSKFKKPIFTDLGSLTSFLKPSAVNLGVIFDSELCFNKQISSVVKNSFYQLRTISKIKHSLSYHNLEIVIHAFITSRLDYCNSLYLGLPQSLISRLQIVQNAAARLLTGSKKWEHITLVLASLHWLPVQQRIIFKTVLMVFKAIHGQAPSYISDLLHPVQPPGPLDPLIRVFYTSLAPD